MPSSTLGRKEYGPPTTRDSQGRNLFTRPSDGNLVHLHCCVPGCEKTNFPNALALRNHVCSPAGLHKLKGLLTSNGHAIEVCGRFAQGPENSSVTARDQPFGAPLVADMNNYHLQSKASSRSTASAEATATATFNKTVELDSAQDLGRGNRTRSLLKGCQKQPKTRAEEAAEVFDGFMSSDSDSDESDDKSLSPDSAGMYALADRLTTSSTCARAGGTFDEKRGVMAGGDSALVIPAVDNNAVKHERSSSSWPVPEHLECQPSPKALAVALEAECVPNPRTEANHAMSNVVDNSVATGKRANSAPPVTLTSITKRARLSDEN